MNNTTIFYTFNHTNYLNISGGVDLLRPHNYLFSLIHNLLNCLNFVCNFAFQSRKNSFFPHFSKISFTKKKQTLLKKIKEITKLFEK